ncbi:MAG: U32 family peptidase [Eggerthellaceae bacterium]|nr:U32 family peptidase [Eggerthellaceae bacterium]
MSLQNASSMVGAKGLSQAPELLAPAGSMEALRAAVANGADAVYLGMRKFGARAYSANFDAVELAEAVAYAHLRGVKVYVTVNTIVFESELAEVFSGLHVLNEMGVDGVIAQDLAVLRYVASHFEDMEAHCSTQMGIDDVEGALLARELGAARVVVAREASIERVLEIRERAGVSVEAFVHGALCVSYSGNCIMSGMTGNRSGNRGRCIGSCRKLYDVVELGDGEGAAERVLGRSYILSTKDLSTIEHVDRLAGIDSLKIEGRMKEPNYVANVVSRYRMALDGTAERADKEKLGYTFNRTFTKGYMFGEDRRDIVNAEKPNHHGYRIGAVAGFRKGMYELTLERDLRQNDLIRIWHDGEDVNLSAAKIYDAAGRLISGAAAGESCYIKVRERLSRGDVVYKTKDLAYEKELEARLSGEFRRFPLNMVVYAYPGAPLSVDAEAFGLRCTYEGDEPLSEALKQPTTREMVVKQLDRLNDTVFDLGKVDYEDNGAFVPAKMLNEARRSVVDQLCALRLAAKPRREKAAGGVEGEKPVDVRREEKAPYLTAFATTREQYEACRDAGIDVVYFRNVASRNNCDYEALDARLAEEDAKAEVLVGGMGGVLRYRGTRPFVTDYSHNVVNSRSCYELHRLGASRVTLSYEINEGQLRDLLEAYRRDFGCSPALEMVVYGHAPLLVTRYCPLKKMGQCGACRTRRYEIRDEFGAFPILPHENCDTTVLNGRRLNLLDEMGRIEGVEAFRLNFTIESAEEVRRIVALARGKLEGALDQPAFNPETDTRGYFNKEIL